jgi:hypothetical protein
VEFIVALRLKKGYYGGIVDVYKPYAKFVRSVDVNSLYPFSMKNFPMPVGKPTSLRLEGNPKDYIKDVFGFVYVKVYAPNFSTPILPHKVVRGAISTLYPIGT